jgi:5-methylcytosine-specific restriction endonuclease McrA
MDTTQLPKTRAEAKAVGAKYYFTGAPCKHGHIAPRKTKGACVECLRVEWAQGNEVRAEYFREYNRSEAGQAAKERYYEKNRAAVIARAQARPLMEKRAYKQKYKEANPDLYNTLTSLRRRRFRDATPRWLSRRQRVEIRQLYQIAMTMSRTTGEQYVVDHIYPLRSDVVCGLHVPWNLRVVTQAENLRKSNMLPDDSEALAFPPKP